METAQSLNLLPVGKEARVINITSSGSMRRRLQDIGIIEGTKIKCLYKSPAGDPVAYFIKGAVIALRNQDSKNIFVLNYN